MNENINSIYNRTLVNCRYYENNGDKVKLLNEIGVLRGICYCVESMGLCLEDFDFNEFRYFIGRQNDIEKELEV